MQTGQGDSTEPKLEKEHDMNGMPPAPLAPPPVAPDYGVPLGSGQLGFAPQGFALPHAPLPNPGSSRMKLGAVVGAVAVGLAAGALWGGLGPAPSKSPSEVRLEAISFAGDSPFMPPVGEDRSGVDAPVNTAGTFSGDTPGLFAADENKPSCDTRTLISNLQADPGKAGAWADAVGIASTDIPAYVDTLNPVVLRSDTAVTQYGYENGTFVPYPAVLEAGTAAFVNSHGEPRAKCFSGNPLSGTPALENVSYVGPTWNHFAPTTVTYVKPAPVVIKVYVYVDIDHHNSYHHNSKPSWDRDELSWCDRHPDADKCDHHGGKHHDGKHGKDHDGNGGGKDHDGDGKDHGNGGKDDQNGGKDGPDGKNGQDGKDGPGGKDGPDGQDGKVVDDKNGQPKPEDQAKLLAGNGNLGTLGGGTQTPPKVDAPTGQRETPPVQAPVEKLFKHDGNHNTGSGGPATGTGGPGTGGSGTGTSTSGSTSTGGASTGTGPRGTGLGHRIGRPTGAGTGTGSATGTGTGTGSATGTTAGTGSSTRSGGESGGKSRSKGGEHND